VASVAPVQPLVGHNRKVVKDLIEESRFETRVRKSVRAKMALEVEAEERDRLAAIPPAQRAADSFIATRNTMEDHNG
jgi:hypothetical protein